MHPSVCTKGAALILAALLLLLSPSAQAAETNGLGFSVVPDDAPQGYIHLKPRPGETVTSALTVTNRTEAPIDVILRRQDAQSASTGGLQYVDTTDDGTGRWVALADNRVALAAGESKRVTVTARIPDDARPGDHFAGIVAYDGADLERVKGSDGDQNSMQLKFISRFAVAIRFTLPGAAQSQLSPGDVSIDSTPQGAGLIVGIENSGERFIPSAEGRVTVAKDGQELFSAPVSIRSHIPKSTIRYRIPWQGTPAEGTYKVTGFVTPSKGRGIEFDETVTFGTAQGDKLEDAGQPVVRAQREFPMWLWSIPALLGALAIVFLIAAAPKRRRRTAMRHMLDDAFVRPAPEPAPPPFVATSQTPPPAPERPEPERPYASRHIR